MTAPTRAELLEKVAAGTLFDALFNEYGRMWFDESDPTIEALTSLHNDGEVDLLALVTPKALEPYKGPVFFQGQHLYMALIGKLYAPAEALIAAVDTLIVAAGHDFAAGRPMESLAKWCKADSSRPFELLDLVDRKVPRADRFLTLALACGVAVDSVYFADRAYGFLNAGTQAERVAAIKALGQIPLPLSADWDRLVAAFEAALTPDPGDVERSAILAATARRLNNAPATHVTALTDIAVTAIAPRGDQTLHECARVLAFDSEALPTPLVETLLNALVSLNPEHARTIESLDFGLMKLVEKGDPTRPREFLARLLARGEEGLTLEPFGSLRDKLFEADRRVLEDWAVAWLRSGNLTLCNEMSQKLFGAGPRADEFVFVIDFARFALAEAELAYLARKAIGFFFLKPVIMASFLTSLLRYSPTGPAAEIEELLFDPILVNYTGVARKHVEVVAADASDPAAPAAQRVLDRLNTYLDGLRSAGRVAELRPSERERQLEWQRQSDEMARVYDAARKKSIFVQLMRQSVMLYGTRFVRYVRDAAGVPRRVAADLGSFGASFEMPRMEIIDPVGLQFMLLTFRGESPPE
jgi:hypothetical protein